MKSLSSARSPLLAAAATVAVLAVACGSAGSSSDVAPAVDSPSATGPAPGDGQPSTPGAAADAGPSAEAGSDAGDGAIAPPTSRAKCGAPAYNWLPAAMMGNVLESISKAPHTPLELNYLILQAKNDGVFKTQRLAKLGTKSKLLRYQTQDRGKAIDATMLMAYPDASGAKTYPILLVLHGTAGFTDSCAPSGGVAEDSLGGFSNETSILLSLFASFGYIVVAPDYIGLKSLGAPTGFLHPYLVGEPTAIASLDAVRAAKKQLAGGNVTPGDVVVVGGSQGGHGAAFVNRFLPHYAPELVIKGSVCDVPPTDILGQAKPALTSWKNATKNLIALTTTYESWYGTATGGLASAFLPPYDTSIPAALATSCSPSSAFANATRETLFTSSFLTSGQQAGFGGLAPWACYLAENSLPTTSIPKQDSIPSMFLIGENDELVDNVVERASFQKLCTQGHVLSFLECAGASHTKPLSYALDQWLDFLQDRLDGKPLAGTCVLKPAETCSSTP
jgi:acetyl esterase/lipase